jgi:hypothetical protein
MKKFTLMIAGLGIAAATVPSVASAQNYGNWQTINSRQANLDRRIDMGIRNRTLSRNEAIRLRAEFRQVAQLEARYRRGGLSLGERRDLDRRFDALSARIKYERNDRNGRRH